MRTDPAASALALALGALALAGCSEPAAEGRRVSLSEHEASAPTEWEAREPGSSMRLAEFEAGAGVEVVVYYFGPGQGGSAEANVTRWESQFTGPDGGAVEATVRELEGTAFPTTLAELEGAYTRGIGVGVGSGGAEPDQALLAAVVEAPDGSLFPQMFGPREAVADRRDDFLEFVRSIGPPGG